MEILHGSDSGEAGYESNAGGFAFEKTDRNGNQTKPEDNLVGKGPFKWIGQ